MTRSGGGGDTLSLTLQGERKYLTCVGTFSGSASVVSLVAAVMLGGSWRQLRIYWGSKYIVLAASLDGLIFVCSEGGRW